MGSAVVGIDLGTANSCVAAVRDGKAVVLLDGNRRTVPSALALAGEKELVGDVARRQAITDPESTVVCVKRLLGHGFESPEVQAARERVAYAIRPSPLGSVLLEIGGREFTPVQVSARILQRIKEVASEALGQDVNRAVISVPAHFNDVQRKATKLAAEYAGIEVLRLVNEPTAAAFAYGYRKGEDFTLAVFDLGGGTFDITVMEARGDRFEVVATDGDSYLGGEDLDQAVCEWLHGEFRREFGRDLAGDSSALLRLKQAAEQAKIELSEVSEARIEIPYLTQLPDGTRPTFTRTLTREELARLTAPLVERTLAMCRRCLEEGGVPVQAIDEVLLVGGQSRMPLVRERVKEFFGKEPRRDIDPDEVVALGAALYAYSLSADSLQAEAEEAAGDAFAVALKGTQVARKVVAGIKELDPSIDLPELRERLQQLLAQTGEGDLPSPREGEPTLPRRRAEDGDLPEPGAEFPSSRFGDRDLPREIDELRSEVSQLSEEARGAVGRLSSELRDEGPQSLALGEELEQLSTQLSSQLEARLETARQKTDEARERAVEAGEHKSARRVDLVDVTSLALGIASAADLFTALIPHNSRVPCEKKRLFTTHQNGQREVEINVHQGREQRASANQLLGNFILEGIEPAPRMEPKIEVTFAIDPNGILSVSARDSKTGAEQSIRVEDPLGLQQVKREDAERREREMAQEEERAREEAKERRAGRGRPGGGALGA